VPGFAPRVGGAPACYIEQLWFSPMSAIDCYKHEHIGFVRCPMRHSLFRDGRVLDFLPVYCLLEDITKETFLSGRAGDILIGGGSGEARAVSFSIPDIFTVYTTAETEDAITRDPCITSHWSADEAFMFGVGFEALGWNPERQPLLTWLAEHLISYLVRTFPERYATLIGKFSPEQDGSIFYR
jgi:hypothetical protein